LPDTAEGSEFPGRTGALMMILRISAQNQHNLKSLVDYHQSTACPDSSRQERAPDTEAAQQDNSAAKIKAQRHIPQQ